MRSPDILIFMRTADDIATCMYYTGIDPFTGDEVYTARKLSDRKLQRALLQFFKPRNDFEVRQALLRVGRGDLIGSHCDALIPAPPPKPALQDRRAKPNRALSGGGYVHSIPTRAETDRAAPTRPPSAGYRPGRKSARRRRRR